jgi:hypothetical protein
MKKHITLLSGLLIFSGAFAQVNKNLPQKQMKQNAALFTESKMPVSSVESAEKAPGDVLWSNNFSSSNNWVITQVGAGAPGPNIGWQLGTAPNQITTWAFPSNTGNFTGGGGYAGVENGNPQQGTQLTGMQFILTYDSIFDLSATGNVLFQFQQYGALFTDKQAVEASIDGGTTWVEIGNNDDMGMLTASGGSAFTNPTNRSYNVSQAFGGAPLTNMKFRFRVYWPNAGANDGVMYGWFVDNVKFVEGYSNDLEMYQAFNFTGVQEISYTRFPTSQAGTPDGVTTFTGKVKNLGDASQDVTLTVTQGAFTSSNAAAVTIAGFGVDSIATDDLYTIPTTVGTYNFSYALSSNNTLDQTANDTKSLPFQVTDKVMGCDAFTNAASISGGFFGWATQTGDPAIGTIMEIFNDESVGAIQIGIAGVNTADQATYIGRSIYGVIYVFNGTDWEYYGQTEDYEIKAGDFAKIVKCYFDSPLPLTAGDAYLVMAAMYDQAEVPIAFSGFVPAGYTIGLDGQDIVGLIENEIFGNVVECPVVRLDFNDYTSIEEISSVTELSVAPNPFAAETAISFNLKNNAEVSVVVTDLAGRVVATVAATQMNAGAQTIAINGAAFEAGVYNATLTVGTDVVTKRIVKK